MSTRSAHRRPHRVARARLATLAFAGAAAIAGFPTAALAADTDRERQIERHLIPAEHFELRQRDRQAAAAEYGAISQLDPDHTEAALALAAIGGSFSPTSRAGFAAASAICKTTSRARPAITSRARKRATGRRAPSCYWPSSAATPSTGSSSRPSARTKLRLPSRGSASSTHTWRGRAAASSGVSASAPSAKSATTDSAWC